MSARSLDESERCGAIALRMLRGELTAPEAQELIGARRRANARRAQLELVAPTVGERATSGTSQQQSARGARR